MRTLLSGYLLSSQGDRMLMANSVEGRFPFLDLELAALADSLPPSYKLRVLDEKHVLKRVGSGTIPREIVERKKQPYRAPDAMAFAGPDSPAWIREVGSERALAEAGVFHPPAARQVLNKCLAREASGQFSNSDNMAVVGILSTQLVHDTFIRRAPRADSAAGARNPRRPCQRRLAQPRDRASAAPFREYMPLFALLPFAAAILSLLLGLANLLRKKPSLATWCFFAGMAILAVESVFTGLGLRATNLADLLRWLTLAFVAKSFVPVAWLSFSLTYSRGDYRESLARWRIPLAVFALLPIGLSIGFQGQLIQASTAGPAEEMLRLRFGVVGELLNVILLVALVLILMNLEQTFRSAVGTMRWRIKFVVLGLAVIFGARLYARNPGHPLLGAGHGAVWRRVERAPGRVPAPRTRLRAHRVRRDRGLPLPRRPEIVADGPRRRRIPLHRRRAGPGGQPFRRSGELPAAGLLRAPREWRVLAALLFSDRLRQRVHRFVGRHFRKAQHDSVRIWAEFSRRLGGVRDQAGLCGVSARLISETFEALSVNIWLIDGQNEQLIRAASTAPQAGDANAGERVGTARNGVAAALGARSSPFDLEDVNEPWAEELRQLNPTTFPNGGRRWCVPLRTGERAVGALVLADRVNGADYTVEDTELLQCIADQMTSALLNLRLANEVARARELDAFRTMSAFFVHDLKNAAASLNLMLKNLPVHFDDPAFREDALRGVGQRGSAHRRDDRPAERAAAATRVQAGRNRLEPVGGRGARPPGTGPGRRGDEGVREPLPRVLADREQFLSVLTNLLLNARDAVSGERAENRASRTMVAGGRIQVRTEPRGGRVVLSVSDNGCGMSPAFVRESLFRPFQSTKKKGLGIGMYQSRLTVEAHGGSIQVESEAGRGTTVRVSLPAKP